MTKILLVLTAALAAAALAVSLATRPGAGLSPTRIAGAYVKQIAQANGIHIIGDKVWSIRKTAAGEQVIVRVKFSQTVYNVFTGQTMTSPPQWVTVYVPLIGPPWSVL